MARVGFPFSEALRVGLAAGLLALGLLVAGCSSTKAKGPEAVVANLDKMRTAATRHVEDPQRRSALLQSIDGLQVDLDALRRVDFDTMTQIRALNTRPDVSRAEMEAALDSLDQQRRQARERVVRHHFEMTAATTAAEWNELAGLERKALMSATQ